MKKFKNLKITNTTVICDGKKVDFKNVPTVGKKIQVKLYFEYTNVIISDNPYVSESTGYSICADDDAFDFKKGLSIAKARAIENMILQVNKVVKTMVRSVLNVLDVIEDEHMRCIRILSNCGKSLSKSDVSSKIYVHGGDIGLLLDTK